MNESLAEYIIKELGNDLYDELCIDPEDYSNKPAYEFYQEIINNCQIERPDIIKKYKKYSESLYNTARRQISKVTADKDRVKADFVLACQVTKDIIDHTGKYRLCKPDYIWLNRFQEPFLNMLNGKSYKELEDYLNKNSTKNIPHSKINCIEFMNKVKWFAARYISQYKEKHA